jgi:hypothetical protein
VAHSARTPSADCSSATATGRNAAVLVGPDGLIGTYWKTHLPFLGVDRFTTRATSSMSGRRCSAGSVDRYDLRFPEVTRRSRCTVPTWSRTDQLSCRGERQTEIITLPGPPRTASTVDREPGKGAARRVLRSQPDRRPLRHLPREVDPTEETLLVAEVDVEKARDKIA